MCKLRLRQHNTNGRRRENEVGNQLGGEKKNMKMAQALISSSIRQGAQMRKKNTSHNNNNKKWRIHLGYQVLPCLAHFSQPLHRWRMLMMAASFDNKTHTHKQIFKRFIYFFQENFFFGFHHLFWYFFLYSSAPSTPVWDDAFSWFTFLRYFYFFIYARLGNPNQKVHLKKNDNPKGYRRERERERK